jgi:hypothetical protein
MIGVRIRKPQPKNKNTALNSPIANNAAPTRGVRNPPRPVASLNLPRLF